MKSLSIRIVKGNLESLHLKHSMNTAAAFFSISLIEKNQDLSGIVLADHSDVGEGRSLSPVPKSQELGAEKTGE